MNARRGGWELPVLLLVAACAALPGLFDIDVFKTGVLALLAAAVLLPWLLWTGMDDIGSWFSTPGARLLLFAAAWSSLSSMTVLRHAAVADRLLGVALCHVAAVLGLRASARAPVALAAALQAVTLVAAVMALLQAVGIDKVFTTGPEEIVALMGNSTRAGALLALGVVAAFAVVTDLSLDARDWRMRLALSTLLLGTAALVLTRARGGWLAATGGTLAVALATSATTRARLRLWLPRVLLGLALAVLLAEDHWNVLTAAKLPGSGPILSAQDVTTHVRLSIWKACVPMIEKAPLEGWGLGRFRERFPPFRDPAEAALPGLGGARTEVDHPHNEFVLALTEGGLPSGLCLLAFAVMTLWRGGQRARDSDSSGDALAFGVLVAGTLTALVQNAWTSPGTALPFFAAAGWVWRPDHDAVLPPAARAATGAGLLAVMAGLLFLALPRLDSHLALRRFEQRAHVEFVTLDNIPLLVRAADADPGDPDVQRLLLFYGSQVEAAAPGASAGLPQALQRARNRLAALAPNDTAPAAPPPPAGPGR